MDRDTPLRIVFDLDGTLIDSAPDIRQAANTVLAREGVPPLDRDEVQSFIGNGAPVFVDRMMAARSLPEANRDRVLDAFLDLYETAVDLTTPYPDVIETLARLCADGHALGLCTNKPESPARAVMQHLDLDGFFDVVIGGDTLPRRKPDPSPLLAAFHALGQGAAIYVGDSEVDAATAEAAGIPFLLFTEGYRKAPPADLPHAARFSAWPDMPALLHYAHVR
ncbi:phosphoglycolate phosphatase [Palleronia abyssalis]|uniref:Phosphoglycolate phosphatase n=1 Tax=Palleronia abyssalis TaxID=1501240 RepID=A0A2R8BYU1_9RHOB|nr:phosphoglycolate phosphatase [Palleronia abyssalis]SPJ25314.1 Phosphoglycolate phosphatase [Palleronia abyssalis]